MALVRRFNNAGVGAFADYLRRLTEDGAAPPPTALLEDRRYSQPTELGSVHVARRHFADRRAFAKYIDERFREAGLVGTVDEPGLWEWLSLFYFNAVCPADAQGRRRPGAMNRHLVNSAFARRRNRHLLRGPYMLHRRHGGGADGELDLLLGYRLHVHGVAATTWPSARDCLPVAGFCWRRVACISTQSRTSPSVATRTSPTDCGRSAGS